MDTYILDSIHGNIRLNKNVLDIIDTIEFQRLRKIKQLGNAHYIFMSATHTRFEHSIGVSHLSGLLLKNIKSNQPELNIMDRDIVLIQVAGLCHDLGHGCFSHLFDSYFLKIKLQNTDKILYADHEYRSEILFKHIVNKYRLEYTSDEINFICELINKKKSEKFKSNKPKYMYEIVANCISGLDCDKIDYLIRDTKSIGIASSFSYDKMFQCARVINDSICYPDDEILNLYSLYHLRFIMHKKVYQHHIIKQLDYMILDILMNVDDELSISTNINNIEKFITYTDSILDVIKYTSSNTVVLDIINRIETRQLYKCIYTSINTSGTLDIKVQNFISFIAEAGIDNIIIDNSHINFSMSNKNPVNEIYFYNEKNLNEKFKIKKKDVSLILPNVFQEIVTRIILKTDKEMTYNDELTTSRQLCDKFLNA